MRAPLPLIALSLLACGGPQRGAPRPFPDLPQPALMAQVDAPRLEREIDALRARLAGVEALDGGREALDAALQRLSDQLPPSPSGGRLGGLKLRGPLRLSLRVAHKVAHTRALTAQLKGLPKAGPALVWHARLTAEAEDEAALAKQVEAALPELGFSRATPEGPWLAPGHRLWVRQRAGAVAVDVVALAPRATKERVTAEALAALELEGPRRPRAERSIQIQLWPQRLARLEAERLAADALALSSRDIRVSVAKRIGACSAGWAPILGLVERARVSLGLPSGRPEATLSLELREAARPLWAEAIRPLISGSAAPLASLQVGLRPLGPPPHAGRAQCPHTAALAALLQQAALPRAWTDPRHWPGPEGLAQAPDALLRGALDGLWLALLGFGALEGGPVYRVGAALRGEGLEPTSLASLFIEPVKGEAGDPPRWIRPGPMPLIVERRPLGGGEGLLITVGPGAYQAAAPALASAPASGLRFLEARVDLEAVGAGLLGAGLLPSDLAGLGALGAALGPIEAWGRLDKEGPRYELRCAPPQGSKQQRKPTS